ncbi:MAG: hypothetical protein ACH344_07065 [Yersinia sp. (in: enterobacteria)]|jgi:hypothetical protein
MKNISFSIVLALMLPGVSLHAKDEHMVYNRQGIATFQVRFFDNGDGFFIQNDPDCSGQLKLATVVDCS